MGILVELLEEINYLHRFSLILVVVRSSRDTFEGKDDQFSVFHPPRAGRIHSHLGIPAEEPAHSSQEETHGLLQQAHLAQRR